MADVNNPPSGGFQHGGWYWDPKIGQAKQYNKDTGFGGGSTINNPQQQGFGQQVSADVQRQSGYVAAKDLQAPVNLGLPSGQSASGASLSGEVDASRKAIEANLAAQKAEADRKLADLKKKEEETLAKVGTLTTPFRNNLETTERERLFINQNFEANQKLTNELDQLLTQGNQLIEQQKQVTGLAVIRNPRIQKTMEDVNARAGVIEAVMNARNSQIGQAYNMIDRRVNAIAQDREDQISYYNTILELNRRDILSLDTDSKKIAEEQLGLLKVDLSRAQETQDYVKKLLINPETAQLMGEGGVTLSDSVGEINVKLQKASQAREVVDMSNKMAVAGYSSVTSPSSATVTLTDAKGNKYYYQKVKTEGSGNVKAADYPVYGGTTATAKSTQPPFSAPKGNLFTDAKGITWISLGAGGWKKK